MPEADLLRTVRLRLAGPPDAAVLRDLEQAANLAALAHVFPVELHLFPAHAVEQRWAATLVEPAVDAWLALGRDDQPVGFVAHDDGRVRHLAVRPDHRGAGPGAALLACPVEVELVLAGSGA